MIAPYRGITAFEFRIANERNTSDGAAAGESATEPFRDEERASRRGMFHELALERRQVVFFPLSWTIVHPIDETSPLWGLTHDDLAGSDAEFLILLTGYDETFATTLHTRSSYRAEEVDWDARFKSIYTTPGDRGIIRIDVGKLDDIEGVSRTRGTGTRTGRRDRSIRRSGGRAFELRGEREALRDSLTGT